MTQPPTNSTTAPAASPPSTQKPRCRETLAVFTICWVALAGHAAVTGRLAGPPRNPDGVSYHAIGIGLAEGHGYATAHASPRFRQPYEAAGQSDALPPPGEPSTTALRPPLLPTVHAVAARTVGPRFWLLRLLTTACVAAATAITFRWVATAVLCTRNGDVRLAAGLLIALAVVVDYRTREMSRTLLTEPLAALFVAAAVDRLIVLTRTNRLRDGLWVGVWLGLAALTRTAIVLWLPVLAATWCIVRWTTSDQTLAGSARAAAVWTGVALLIVSPWIVRNARLPGRHLLGTQGSLELPAGFSDAAWDRRGIWDIESRPGFELAEGFAAESQQATSNRRIALDWIQHHPEKAAVLFPLKVLRELGPHAHGDVALWILAALGIAASWPRAAAWVPLLPVVATLVVVGVTWSVAGRFLWPVAPLMHGLATLGLFHAVVSIRRNRTVTAAGATPPANASLDGSRD